MPRNVSFDTNTTKDKTQRPEELTWYKIRTRLVKQYAKWYTPGELRQMEIKWRRILSQCGWSVKGQ